MTVAVWVGFGFNAVGTVLAAVALVKDWREHSTQPFAPAPLRRLVAWFRVHILRRRPAVPRGRQSATGTATYSGTAFGLAPPPAIDVPYAEQVEYLHEQVRRFHRRMEELEQHLSGRVDMVADSVAEVRRSSDQSVADLDRKVRDIVTGNVKVELFGLLLVGVGSAIPVIFG